LIARSQDPFGLRKCIDFSSKVDESIITAKIRKEIMYHLGDLPRKLLTKADCGLPAEV
jgi:hypothetical protein